SYRASSDESGRFSGLRAHKSSSDFVPQRLFDAFGIHIASISMDRLAMKVAMEANAAISRIRSVIVVSFVPLCFYFVLFLCRRQQENKAGISEMTPWLTSEERSSSSASAAIADGPSFRLHFARPLSPRKRSKGEPRCCGKCPSPHLRREGGGGRMRGQHKVTGADDGDGARSARS